MAETFIDIQSKTKQTATNKAQFTPSPKQAAPGDLIYWRNYDQKNAHWPMPKGGQKDDWMPFQISPGQDGEPTVSLQNVSVSLNPGQTSLTLNYVCALHADETGSIIIGTAGPTLA